MTEEFVLELMAKATEAAKAGNEELCSALCNQVLLATHCWQARQLARIADVIESVDATHSQIRAILEKIEMFCH